MRGQEFRARDKKVRKMTRDGLTEKNLAAGTEERISGRLADVSFGREKTEDTAAGRRAQSCIRKTMRGSGVPARDTGKKAEGRNQPGAERRRIAKKGNAGEKRQDRKALPPGETARPDMAEVEDISEIRPDRKKRMAARCPGGGRKPGKAVRLRYEKSEIPPEERAGERAAEDVNPAGEKEAAKPRRMKQYEKAQRRVERAEGKLKKAQENLPARTHVRLQKEYDSESGKVRRRLHFETEVIPENEKPVLVKRAGRAAGSAVYTAAVLKAHQKIREVEADNVGVEASHKVEFAAERFAGTALRKRRQRLREKPYREVRRAQGRLAQANAGMAYQKFLSENPELEKKALAKWLQKRKLKRRYAAAAREAAKGMKHTTQVFSAAGGAVRALAQAAVSHKAVLGVVGIGMLIISMFGSLFSSCCAMLSGVQSAVTATCYVADDAQINQSELRYTELETDLQIEIGRTQEDYPGYDEYRLQIGEIGHNPYELMGYLS
ncbi:MAG: peptidase M24, partial [Dorea sp.]|nr:peptidase M24 [Dorea sp.]